MDYDSVYHPRTSNMSLCQRWWESRHFGYDEISDVSKKKWNMIYDRLFEDTTTQKEI